jgi:hypothetical protein
LHDLPIENHVIAVQLECDVIEGAKVRKGQNLVAHLFGDALLGLAGEGALALHDHRGGNKQRDDSNGALSVGHREALPLIFSLQDANYKTNLSVEATSELAGTSLT